MASATPSRVRTSPAPRPAGPRLGATLCWAVVFADIGTSVYYTPGILFGQVGTHAALFVALTLVVFVLLTIKYAEVAIRYPEGGGVVTVGAHAFNPLTGLIGGLFILVDYFLTSALSALSGLIYLTVLAPGLHGGVVWLTVAALALLAGLNLIGISANAKVTAVVATVALVSQLAVVVAVLIHVGVGTAAGALHTAAAGPRLGGLGVLTGFAGAFLAFSGLESISQLAPAMAPPQRRVAPRAMRLVVVTVVLTSPLLTLWSTTLLDAQRDDPNQFVSVLAGFAAGPLLQTEVAATAALLLVFASNTAIIGCYHVFLALSRMRFLPRALEQRNALRDTPHWAILAATAVPIGVVIASNGSVTLLGDLYAFGLLGAFSLTCVCLDVVRHRERRAAAHRGRHGRPVHGAATSTPMFITGIATSVLVVMAWTTNLFAKPLATLFGGCVTVVGLVVAGTTHRLRTRRREPGLVPVVHRFAQYLTLHRRGGPSLGSVLAMLHGGRDDLEELVRAGIAEAHGGAAVFAYVGGPSGHGIGALLEVVDPYLGDEDAHRAFRTVERLCGRRRHHFVYEARDDRRAATAELIGLVHPATVVVLRSEEALLPPTGGLLHHRRHNGVAITTWVLDVDAPPGSG